MELEAEGVVDVQRFLEDTLRTCGIESPVPEVTRQQECCMGIDEAGRGPVLGNFQIKHTMHACQI